MRGTPVKLTEWPKSSGIIPAYAGNTKHQSGRKARSGDHPRVCGEHMTGNRIPSRVLGSSPRMRGTRRSTWLGACPCGIIPAYAGNTGRILCRPIPPRIIPAYAGNTSNAPLLNLILRDHPRVCGEHFQEAFEAAGCMGSSPRMRGTHGDSPARSISRRIIPAYAGNTFPRTALTPYLTDHPRVCGEHTAFDRNVAVPSGSSPRMRGTHGYGNGRNDGRGIIPAYAGNTPTAHGRVSASWDHPRVCGEHTKRL